MYGCGTVEYVPVLAGVVSNDVHHSAGRVERLVDGERYRRVAGVGGRQLPTGQPALHQVPAGDVLGRRAAAAGGAGAGAGAAGHAAADHTPLVEGHGGLS